MTRLFWITQKWPLPVEDGARQATFHLVSSLARLGTEIHLLAIVPRGEKVDPEEAKRAFGVARMSVAYREPSRHVVSLMTRPWEPLTFAPYMSKDLARQVLEAHRSWDPDSVIVFDGLHGAGWYFRLSESERQGLKVAHRSHNVESNLWKLGARQHRFPKSVFLAYQARLVAAFEKRVCRSSRLVAAVSRNDEQGLQGLYGRMHSIVTPIGVPMARDPEAAAGFPSERDLLFIGRLDWQPNRDGLRWFLEQVWPDAAAQCPDLRLTIAGAGDGSWIDPYLRLPRLRFLGRVPDLAPLYRSSIASLVPIFFGSGTRVKAIEASSFGRPCISTEIGVEGIGLDPDSSYFRAETREDWIDTLKKLSVEDARKRGQAAFEHVLSEFDPPKVADRFRRELEASV